MPPLAITAMVFVAAILMRASHPVAAAMMATSLLIFAVFRRARPVGPRAIVLIAAAFLAGLWRSREVPLVVPRPRLSIESQLITGTISRGCVGDGESARCVVERDDGRTVSLRVPEGSCRGEPGDRIRAVATVQNISPDINGARAGPGESQVLAGIELRAVASGCELISADVSWTSIPRRLGLQLRRALVRGLERAMKQQPASQSRALLFGDESAIDLGEIRAFRDSGLAHLLAVSGAHVALLTMLLSMVVKSVLRRFPAVTLRGLLAPLSVIIPLPLIAIFVIATGESASAVRSLVGALFVACAALASRRAHGESIVAASTITTAAINPACVFDPGWQLSVVAAWALAAAPRTIEPHEDAPTLVRTIVRSWRDTSLASIRVAIAVLAVLAWHFQRTPISAIGANALAAPLAESILLPLVLATGFLGTFFPLLAKLVGAVTAPILASLFSLPSVALSLPLATTVLPPPTAIQAFVFTALVLIAMRFNFRGRVVAIGLAVLIIGSLEWRNLGLVHPTGVLRVTALDVGQGDSIVVDLPDGTAMLIDSGGNSGRNFDPGARIVVPFLADRRRRELAVVVASHPHPDHIGGIPAVLDWAHVGELWDTRQGESANPPSEIYQSLRRTAQSHGVPVHGPESLCGPPRSFHGAILEVLAPCPSVNPSTPPNDASMVIRISYGSSSVLLPGDLEHDGESRLLAQMHPVTLLKVGHHGSRTSSSEAFLDLVRPRIAIVSAGHPSPFDHPHQEIVERYARRGIPLWSTASVGAVTATLRRDGSFEIGPAEW